MTSEALVDQLVGEIGERFRTFGGGRDSDTNPLAHALRDQPLQFAAGVDVRAVVELVVDALREEGVPAPKHRPTRHFESRGGFGDIADERRVILTRHRTSGEQHIIVMDDSDGVGIGFTPRQVARLIAALGKARDEAMRAKLLGDLTAGKK